ncbi:hypothetical protein Vadar_008226 [Vaccinium darrowii]|uniref:Uncharacterized protein n=1 Tax=Vaccinium darrowii TaxID=229202 RepID=A0ACB7XGL3_9ERIC|nr:hypothetical protein Vadar_008226 [Vaccinium darrowii]
MGSSESNLSNAGGSNEEVAQRNQTARAVAVAIAGAVVIVGAVAIVGRSGLTKLVSSLGSKEKMMKAPGRDYQIPRKDFENSPADYFRDLRKK